MLSEETRRGPPGRLTECSGQLTANKAGGRTDGRKSRPPSHLECHVRSSIS